MEKKIIVYCLEDKQLVISGIENHLPSEEFEFSGFRAAGELIKTLESKKKLPDVLLLDLDLGGGPVQGLNAAKQILQSHPSIKIIVCSITDQPDIIVQLIKMGVKGYIYNNPDDVDIATCLKNAIKDVHFGKNTVFNSPIMSALKDYLGSANNVNTDQDFIIKLNKDIPNAREVLILLANGKKQGELFELLFPNKKNRGENNKYIYDLVNKIRRAFGLEGAQLTSLILHALKKGVISFNDIEGY